MYTPPHNRQPDQDEVFAFMREFPFATLVTCGEGGIVATHVPLHVSRSGSAIRISGHIARANEQCAHLAAGAEAMAVFASPHGYVSPQNYGPGNWVPTWNYIAVHAYGAPQLAEGREAKLAILAATVADHDPGYQAAFDRYPAEFVEAKLKGLVAFSFTVSRIDARWKLSQDRSPEERDAVSLAMRLSADPSAQRLAKYMDARIPAGSP